MLEILFSLVFPMAVKAVEALTDNSKVKVWARLAGEMSSEIPRIINTYGEDVKFTDIDFQSLKAPDWDDE